MRIRNLIKVTAFALCTILPPHAFCQGIQTVKDKLLQKYQYVTEREAEGKTWYRVTLNGLEGICDENGKVIIAPDKYDIAYPESSHNGVWYFNTKKGSFYGICDETGREIIPPTTYSSIYSHSNELCNMTYFEVIIDDKKHGVIDLAGKTVIPAIYDNVYFMYEKTHDLMYYTIYSGGRNGLCDKEGKVVIPPKYDGVYPHFDKDGAIHYSVHINYKYGIVNEHAQEIVPPGKFETVYMQGNKGHRFWTTFLNDKYGAYDISGREIVQAKYDMLYSQQINQKDVFVGWIYDADDKACYSYMDGNGKLLTPADCYDAHLIGDCVKNEDNETVYTGGELLLCSNGKYGIFDLETEQYVVPCTYDYLTSPSEGLLLCNKGGRVTYKDEQYVCNGGKYGFIDKQGNVIIPIEYTRASNFKDGVAQVEKRGVASIIPNPLTGTQLKIAGGAVRSKVDSNIPQNDVNNDETFAFIIACENYTNYQGADFSINDGKIFKEYCSKTFGLPDRNIRYVEDGTYGNIVSLLQKIKDVADVYEGDAKIILYYSGLGSSDPTTKEKFILPVDATTDISVTGYSLNKVMDMLGGLDTKATLVIVDAPFNGTDKKGGMLASDRGVAVSGKTITPKGNTVLLQACGEGETAFSGPDYAHGLFTYALLEKIQDSKGGCSLQEMAEHAGTFVKQTAMKSLDRKQIPAVSASFSFDDWTNVSLK